MEEAGSFARASQSRIWQPGNDSFDKDARYEAGMIDIDVLAFASRYCRVYQ